MKTTAGQKYVKLNNLLKRFDATTDLEEKEKLRVMIEVEKSRKERALMTKQGCR